MKYKTRYKESYAHGSRNLSITISAQALDLLTDNDIDNFSAFINDGILDALTGQENIFLRLKLAEFARMKGELEKEGYEITMGMRKPIEVR